MGNAASYFLVFFGGGLGAMLRHFVNLACGRGFGTNFPYGTFIINITGSTVMGLIAGYLAFKGEASQPWRLFLMTGVLGGYTTFSAFSLDTALLYERGELARISHTVRRIGVPNQRKFFCEKDFAMIRGAPRCRQSVAQSGLILEGWKAASWKRPLMVDW